MMQASLPQNNLGEHLEWLRSCNREAQFRGFCYAPEASKEVQKPIVFNFENAGRRASKCSLIAAVSKLGQVELEMFRRNQNSSSSSNSSKSPSGNRGSSGSTGIVEHKTEPIATVTSFIRGNNASASSVGISGSGTVAKSVTAAQPKNNKKFEDVTDSQLVDIDLDAIEEEYRRKKEERESKDSYSGAIRGGGGMQMLPPSSSSSSSTSFNNSYVSSSSSSSTKPSNQNNGGRSSGEYSMGGGSSMGGVSAASSYAPGGDHGCGMSMNNTSNVGSSNRKKDNAMEIELRQLKEQHQRQCDEQANLLLEMAAAVKQRSANIPTLKKRRNELESRIEELDSLISDIEEQLAGGAGGTGGRTTNSAGYINSSSNNNSGSNGYGYGGSAFSGSTAAYQQQQQQQTFSGQTKINGFFSTNTSNSSSGSNRNSNSGGGNDYGYAYAGSDTSIVGGGGGGGGVVRSMITSWDDTADRIAQRSNAQFGTGGPSSYGDDGNNNCPSYPNYNDGAGGGGGDEDNYSSNNPMCACGVPSMVKTSFTEKNYDRKFYCCVNRRRADSNNNNDGGGFGGGGAEYGGCDFFQWEDGCSGGGGQGGSGVGYVQTDGYRDHNVEIRRIFGHEGFRLGQKECVEAALQGKDVFCLMPTGGGKSVVYQLPAWCVPGLSIVFSPLVSLIQDQVDALTAMGINATYMIADGVDNQEIMSELYRYRSVEDIEGADLSGSGRSTRGFKMLYITPERFSKSEALKKTLGYLNRNGLLSRFIIDEAHCLSQWGHDFRPDYLALTNIRTEYPTVPIMALTATANKRICQDCINILKMRTPYLHTQSFNRPNLHYTIRKKESSKLIEEIAKIIKDRPRDTGIIYCLSKKDCETVSEELQGKLGAAFRNKITFYHADVPPVEKERRQKLWSKGDIKVICATIAFGMGINKPDVRYVIHHSIPKSLTNYYQESGRAGRDGLVSECIMFFSWKDKSKLANMIQRSKDERLREGRGNYRDHLENMRLSMDNLHKCVSFCMNDVDCRRVLLLEYFEEKFPRERCKGTCDNCRKGGTVVQEDLTNQANAVLKIVRSIVSRGGNSQLTLVKLCKFCAGSKDKDSQKLEKLVTVDITCTASLAKLSKDTVERLVQQMVLRNYLKEEAVGNASGFSADYLGIGDDAWKLDQNSERLLLAVRRKSSSTSKDSTAGAAAAADADGWTSAAVSGADGGVHDGRELPSSKGAGKNRKPREPKKGTGSGTGRGNNKPSAGDGSGKPTSNPYEFSDDENTHTNVGRPKATVHTKASSNHTGSSSSSAAAAVAGAKPRSASEIYGGGGGGGGGGGNGSHTVSSGSGLGLVTKQSSRAPPPTSSSSSVPHRNNSTGNNKRASDSSFEAFNSDEDGDDENISNQSTRKGAKKATAGIGKAAAGGSGSVVAKKRQRMDSILDLAGSDDDDDVNVASNDGDDDWLDAPRKNKPSSLRPLPTTSSSSRNNTGKMKATAATAGASAAASINNNKRKTMKDSSRRSTVSSHDNDNDHLDYDSDDHAGGEEEEGGEGDVTQMMDDDDYDGSRIEYYDHDNNEGEEEHEDGDDDKEEEQRQARLPKSLLSRTQKVDFIGWLTAYRLKWTLWWNHLSTTSITDISEKVPQTLEQLAKIREIGESRAQNDGQEILATIYAFLEKHDLLHLFPLIKPPTIAPCPSWMDPESAAAEEARIAMSDIARGRSIVRDSRPTGTQQQPQAQAYAPTYTQAPPLPPPSAAAVYGGGAGGGGAAQASTASAYFNVPDRRPSYIFGSGPETQLPLSQPQTQSAVVSTGSGSGSVSGGISSSQSQVSQDLLRPPHSSTTGCASTTPPYYQQQPGRGGGGGGMQQQRALPQQPPYSSSFGGGAPALQNSPPTTTTAIGASVLGAGAAAGWNGARHHPLPPPSAGITGSGGRSGSGGNPPFSAVATRKRPPPPQASPAAARGGVSNSTNTTIRGNHDYNDDDDATQYYDDQDHDQDATDGMDPLDFMY